MLGEVCIAVPSFISTNELNSHPLTSPPPPPTSFFSGEHHELRSKLRMARWLIHWALSPHYYWWSFGEKDAPVA